MKNQILFTLMLMVIFFGCSKPDCTDQMAETKLKHGVAEEVNSYHSEGYHNIDWWYWSRGFQYSFTWGDNVKGCQVSVFTFSPIQTAGQESQAEISKVLTEQYYCPETNVLY